MNIHVFGGTSDSVKICQYLEHAGYHYSLSVATQEGMTAAAMLNTRIFCGRADIEDMVTLFKEQKITHVIDATHPFACIVSENIIEATKIAACALIRYERQTLIDSLTSPLLFIVADKEEACTVAATIGGAVLLTTGSKDLGCYAEKLGHKRLIARVLPTIEAITSCQKAGLGIEQILALKGPFTEAMNQMFYEQYGIAVVITKESGHAGGFQEKLKPALRLGIPVIVIRRPNAHYPDEVHDVQALQVYLSKYTKETL